jgi:hypothetical protein
MNARWLVSLSAAALVMAGADAAHAGGPIATTLDITGVWTGSFSCKGLNGGGETTKPKGTLQVLAKVDSAGNTAMEFAVTGGADGGARGVSTGEGLCGYSIAKAGKPEQGAVTVGATSALGNFVFELDFPMHSVHFKSAKVFAANSKGVSGGLSGSAIVLPYPYTEATACKIKLERVDEVDPSPSMDPTLLTECGI